MAGSTIWLEREVGAVIVGWLGRLSEWTAFGEAQPHQVCLACVRYGMPLRLDSTPHALLHALVTPIDDLIADCFLVVARERYATLVEAGCTIALDDGMVRVGLRDPGEPLSTIERSAFDGLRLELTQLYTELLGRAIHTLGSHRAEIQAAVEATVEPAVLRLTSQLIQEIERIQGTDETDRSGGSTDG